MMSIGENDDWVGEGRLMYYLMVSRNRGRNYHKEKEAETIEELKISMVELDAAGIEWYISKDGKQLFNHICKIHREKLVAYMILNRSNGTNRKEID